MTKIINTINATKYMKFEAKYNFINRTITGIVSK